MRRALALGVLLVGLGVLAAGCGGDDDEAGGNGTTTNATGTVQDDCSNISQVTKTPGTLTVATDNPGFPPWFVGTKADTPWDPTTAPTKKGYEAAVTYAISRELTFADDDVKWEVVPFTQLFKPGEKPYDFAIEQASYTPVRAKALDFTDSYYDVEQAVVTAKGSKIANAKSLADLKDAKLGAQLGTTSYDAIGDVIEPTAEPSVYDTNNDAISALKAKQIDGIVVDYPTSLYMANVQIPGGTIVGRLPRESTGKEYFGIVTEKGSPLIPCLNDAIAALREDGTLDELEQTWIVGSAPPVLQ